MCFQPLSLPIGKVSVLMPFCVYLILYIVQSSVGRRFWSTSVQRLRGPSGNSLLALLCGYWSSLISFLTQFLSNRLQYDVVDGFRSNLINDVLGVPQGCVLGSLLFLLYASELFSSSCMVKLMNSLWLRWCHLYVLDRGVAVAESLTRDLNRVIMSGVTFENKFECE